MPYFGAAAMTSRAPASLSERMVQPRTGASGDSGPPEAKAWAARQAAATPARERQRRRNGEGVDDRSFMGGNLIFAERPKLARRDRWVGGENHSLPARRLSQGRTVSKCGH